MRRFLSALVIALMIVSMLGTAFAVPSKSTTDLTQVEAVTTQNGETATFTVSIVEDTPATTQVVADLVKLVNEDAKPVVTYFPEDTQAKIAASLPEGTDPAQITVSEIFTVQAFNYEDTFGEATVGMNVATVYTEQQQLVIVIGYEENGVMQWITAPGQFVDGKVTFVLDIDTLAKLNAGACTVMILNA